MNRSPDRETEASDSGLALWDASWLYALMAAIKRAKQWPKTHWAMTIIAKCFRLPKQKLESESAGRWCHVDRLPVTG